MIEIGSLAHFHKSVLSDRSKNDSMILLRNGVNKLKEQSHFVPKYKLVFTLDNAKAFTSLG